MVSISIVVPVYNSGECVHELARQIKDALTDISYELILVNDFSVDNSWKEIQCLVSEDDNVIGFNLRKNFGQDNALMAGFNQADGEYVVTMDDDLQHSPYDIPGLYHASKEGYDICYANFKIKNQAVWKNLGSWLTGKIAEKLISKPKNIYLSPFKIIHRDVINEIIKYDGPYPYVDGLLFEVTGSITQIDVSHHSRFKGASNYNLIRSIQVFMKLGTSFSVLPLRLASFAGFISALVGILLGIYYIYEHFTSNETVEGWTTLVVITLFMGGVTLMSLGLIGEYLGRAYLSLNRTPQFIIKDKICAKNP
jgi:polyisoprenyl-phosphate glycosyltransferase